MFLILTINPENLYLFKVIIETLETSRKVCSKLTIKTPSHPFGDFNVNFEHI